MTALRTWSRATSHIFVSRRTCLSVSLRGRLPSASSTSSLNSPTFVTQLRESCRLLLGMSTASAAPPMSSSFFWVCTPNPSIFETLSSTWGISSLLAALTRAVATTNGSESTGAIPGRGMPPRCTTRASNRNGGALPVSSASEESVTFRSGSMAWPEIIGTRIRISSVYAPDRPCIKRACPDLFVSSWQASSASGRSCSSSSLRPSTRLSSRNVSSRPYCTR
mmetsp:Transcript_818/g.2228  ORF Transcript_818/g.2228 Transcript_818/m.2228 type:complete len:222 (+) Transcript_818:1118-1783(+)